MPHFQRVCAQIGIGSLYYAEDVACHDFLQIGRQGWLCVLPRGAENRKAGFSQACERRRVQNLLMTRELQSIVVLGLENDRAHLQQFVEKVFLPALVPKEHEHYALHESTILLDVSILACA